MISVRNNLELKVIAHIKTDFPEKFGIPRQSGLIPSLTGKIVFNKEYANPNAFKGLEGYSHLWIIWGFSESVREDWSPTVRPPRLGGNKRVGVFATRSPFRPNSIGLSSVKIEKIDINENGSIEILVSGIDMMDNTPVYDIKPYIPYTDSHIDAKGGFSEEVFDNNLYIYTSYQEFQNVSREDFEDIKEILLQDPRPAYQNDKNREYGFEYKNYSIKFMVKNNKIYILSIDENT